MTDYLITPRGEKQMAAPKDGVAFSVTELQDMVDGYITIEDIGDLKVVYDVDGDLKGKLYNKTATELIRSYSDFVGFVSGNAVICRRVRVD